MTSPVRASASGIRPAQFRFDGPPPRTTGTSVPKRKAGGEVGPRRTKNVEVPNPTPPKTTADDRVYAGGGSPIEGVSGHDYLNNPLFRRASQGLIKKDV